MRQFLIGSVTVVVCLTGIRLALWTPARDGGETLEPFVSDVGFETLEAPDSAAAVNLDSDRPVYPYSVIPGGAYSGNELRNALATDPVVAAHYQNLDQSKLQVRTLARDQYAYVSYRKGDEVFWTRSKVLLRQGETIITDGTTQIRARCGNCISAEPQLPTADKEPEVVEFDRLVEPVAQPQSGRPELALVPPTSPTDLGAPAVEPLGPPEPLAAGQFGTGSSAPLAVGRRGSDVPGPPVDVPESPVEVPTPLPPFTPGPPNFFLPTPPGDLFPPLDDNPPLYQPPLGEPPWEPPNNPPGEPINPVPVPEPGTLLLVAAGAAGLLRRRRSRSR